MIYGWLCGDEFTTKIWVDQKKVTSSLEPWALESGNPQQGAIFQVSEVIYVIYPER